MVRGVDPGQPEVKGTVILWVRERGSFLTNWSVVMTPVSTPCMHDCRSKLSLFDLALPQSPVGNAQWSWLVVSGVANLFVVGENPIHVYLTWPECTPPP